MNDLKHKYDSHKVPFDETAWDHFNLLRQKKERKNFLPFYVWFLMLIPVVGISGIVYAFQNKTDSDNILTQTHQLVEQNNNQHKFETVNNEKNVNTNAPVSTQSEEQINSSNLSSQNESKKSLVPTVKHIDNNQEVKNIQNVKELFNKPLNKNVLPVHSAPKTKKFKSNIYAKIQDQSQDDFLMDQKPLAYLDPSSILLEEDQENVALFSSPSFPTIIKKQKDHRHRLTLTSGIAQNIKATPTNRSQSADGLPVGTVDLMEDKTQETIRPISAYLQLDYDYLINDKFATGIHLAHNFVSGTTEDTLNSSFPSNEGRSSGGLEPSYLTGIHASYAPLTTRKNELALSSGMGVILNRSFKNPQINVPVSIEYKHHFNDKIFLGISTGVMINESSFWHSGISFGVNI